MADVLFVTKNDIVRFTALNGNVDVDKYLQFVKFAQDSDIQNLLGTKLFEKLKADIVANTLVNPYLHVLETFVKPMTIHFAMVEYLPFAPYTIGNKGVYKHTSETGELVSGEELAHLIEKQRTLAQHYVERFIDYMNYNQTNIPEYYTNVNDDMYPSRNNNFGGWVV